MKMLRYLTASIIFLTATAYPQDPSVMLTNILVLPGQKVVMPLNVTSFNNIGAVSLKIQYDSTVVHFDSTSRRAEFISGIAGGEITIGRAQLDPVTPANGKLLDLFFTYSTGSTYLNFNISECELAYTDGNVIANVNYVNGSIRNTQQQPPVFTAALPDIEKAEGDTLVFSYNASDPENDLLTFSLPVVNPPGTIINSSTGLFTWIIGYDQAGDHKVIVNVTDGVNVSADTAFVLVSNTNRPPYFVHALPDTTIYEGDTLTFNIDVNDPDGDELTIAVKSGPPGIIINPVTGDFSWSPGFKQAGTYNFVFTVTDKIATITDTSRITVINVNHAPYFINTMPDTTIGSMDTLTFQYAAGDSDGVSNLRFGLLNAPPEAMINPITGEFRLRPRLQYVWQHIIIVTLTDQIVTILDTAIVDFEVGIKTELGIPSNYGLSQNYPNPFNPVTTIRFSLPKESFVTLTIYNLIGEKVAVLVNELLPSAYHEYSFDASAFPSGIYIYKLQADKFVSIKKMTFLK